MRETRSEDKVVPANLSRWVIGVLVAIFGLGALLLASRAEQPIMYYSGLIFFIGSVLFNFQQIKQTYDEQAKH